MDDETRRICLEPTPEGAAAFAAWLLREAPHVANDGAPMAFVLHAGDDGRGALDLMMLKVPTSAVATVLRARAAATGAVAVGLVFENWLLSEVDAAGRRTALTSAEILAWRASGREVREHPKASDAVTVVAEHAGWPRGVGRVCVWSAPKDVAANAVGAFGEPGREIRGYLAGPWLAS